VRSCKLGKRNLPQRPLVSTARCRVSVVGHAAAMSRARSAMLGEAGSCTRSTTATHSAALLVVTTTSTWRSSSGRRARTPAERGLGLGWGWPPAPLTVDDLGEKSRAAHVVEVVEQQHARLRVDRQPQQLVQLEALAAPGQASASNRQRPRARRLPLGVHQPQRYPRLAGQTLRQEDLVGACNAERQDDGQHLA